MKMYEENMEKMEIVLSADLKRHRQESVLLEIDVLLNDLRNVLHNFKEWSQPEKVNIFKKNLLCCYNKRLGKDSKR